MDYPYRTVEFRRIERKSYQPILFNVLGHHAPGHDAAATAVFDRFFDHLKIVEMEGGFNRYTMFSKIPRDMSLNREVVVETHEKFSVEVFRYHASTLG